LRSRIEAKIKSVSAATSEGWYVENEASKAGQVFDLVDPFSYLIVYDRTREFQWLSTSCVRPVATWRIAVMGVAGKAFLI